MENERLMSDSILEEIRRVEKSPQKIGILSIMGANSWIEQNINIPDPRTFFNGLIVERENTVLFAQANVGKSILAVQIAESISKTDKVLYLDLEQSGKQFQMRYSDADSGIVHVFPENFYRAEIEADLLSNADLEHQILDSIEAYAGLGVRFFILDNLTFVCGNAEKAADASQFMISLIRLKKKYGLTMIVVSHTPKIHGFQHITQYDLAGSSKIISLFDAGIAIAKSAKDPALRYLKQVKVRTAKCLYGEDNVMVFEIVKDGGCLCFNFLECANESVHLRQRDENSDKEEMMEVLKLQREGKSFSKIGEILGLSKQQVQRRIEKARSQNIAYDGSDNRIVSSVSDTIRTIRPIRPIRNDFESEQHEMEDSVL